MSLARTHPVLFALLLAAPILWRVARMVAARAAVPRSPLTRSGFGWRRGAAWVLLSAALGGLSFDRAGRATRAIVVDRSGSVGSAAGDRDRTLERIRAAAAPGDLLTWIAFGRTAGLAAEPEKGADGEGLRWPELDGEQSDLEAGLRLASAIAAGERSAGAATRLLLVSDGRATRGDAIAAAHDAAALGLPVDVLPVCASASPADGSVLALKVPAEVRQAGLFEIEVSLRAPETTSQLELFVSGRPAGVRELPEGGGRLQRRLVVRAEGLGLVPIEAHLVSAGDPQPNNDRATAATFVVASPTVLWLAETPPPQALRETFEAAGLAIDARSPDDAPADPLGLAAYAAFVVEDVTAERLGHERLVTLRDRVRLDGAGLLACGASSAFGAGGWGGTPLDEILPVDPRPPGRGGRKPLALLLVLDVSGSMGVREQGVEKLEMARRAAAAVLPVLAPGDLLGLIAFGATAQQLRPLAATPDPTSWRTTLDGLVAQGGTALAPALQLAFRELGATVGVRRHALLLSDGRSPPADAAAVEALEIPRGGDGIGLSVVGLGGDVDAELLTRLAAKGEGRFVAAQDTRELATLFTREVAAAAQGRTLATGPLPVRSSGKDPLTAGVRAPETIRGMARTAIRTGALAPWVVAGEGPLLAYGSAGLGRVAALTADPRAAFGRDRFSAGDVASFWGRMGAWIANSAADDDSLALRIERVGAVTRLVVDAVDEQGHLLDGLALQARLARSGEEGLSLDLRQSGPGLYEVDLPAVEPGVWLIRVATRPPQKPRVARLLWSEDPAAEWRESGCDDEALRTIADVGGGHLVGPHDDPLAPRAGRRRESWPTAIAGLAAIALLLSEWLFARRVASRRAAQWP